MAAGHESLALDDSQPEQLIALTGFLRWCTRTHVLRHNPARELVLPRRPVHLPRTVLTRVLGQCNVLDPLGLRDRALLEVLYSTGLRRTEACQLALQDVAVARQVVFVREGKGVRDRAAAKLLGVSQPRVSDLVRGRFHRFSIDALVAMLAQGCHGAPDHDARASRGVIAGVLLGDAPPKLASG